jgi:hypothetical protein
MADFTLSQAGRRGWRRKKAAVWMSVITLMALVASSSGTRSKVPISPMNNKEKAKPVSACT